MHFMDAASSFARPPSRVHRPCMLADSSRGTRGAPKVRVSWDCYQSNGPRCADSFVRTTLLVSAIRKQIIAMVLCRPHLLVEYMHNPASEGVNEHNSLASFGEGHKQALDAHIFDLAREVAPEKRQDRYAREVR